MFYSVSCDDSSLNSQRAAVFLSQSINCHQFPTNEKVCIFSCQLLCSAIGVACCVFVAIRIMPALQSGDLLFKAQLSNYVLGIYTAVKLTVFVKRITFWIFLWAVKNCTWNVKTIRFGIWQYDFLFPFSSIYFLLLCRRFVLTELI